MALPATNVQCHITSLMVYVYVDSKTACNVARLVLVVIRVLTLFLQALVALQDVLRHPLLNTHVIFPTVSFALLKHNVRFVRLVTR
jgi:hypothetical protein